MFVRLMFVAIVFATSISARPSRAQEAEISQEERERDARALFALATRHYETGRLPEAIEEYSRAYALFPLPEFQFNLYLANRDAGNLSEATASLHLYLDSDATIEDERRAMLERRLRSMEANIATPELNVSQEDSPSSGGMSPVIGGVILGVGGALLVGALIEGLVASGKDGELDDICTLNMAGESFCPAEQQADIVSSFETHRNVAWGLFYSGVAVAATGVVLLLLSGGSDDDAVANLECGASGCIGSVRGAF